MGLGNITEKNRAKICGVLLCLFFSFHLYAGSSRERRNETAVTVSKPPAAGAGFSAVAVANTPSEWRLLIGAGEGLFSLEGSAGPQPPEAAPLWSGGSVRKILRAPDLWAILTGEGIFVSTDLLHWENRSQGLPIKTIKTFQDGKKAFLPMVQEIKDLEIHPADSNIMVCATKDRAYLSRNQGRSWTSLGAPPYRTNGIKAVAAAYMPAASANSGANVLTVFLSHSTYGLSYIQPDRAGAQWIEINAGIETLETTGNADEVSDIAVAPGAADVAPAIYVSQSFRRRIYRLDWGRKAFTPRWSDNAPFGTVDSLDAGTTALRFLYEGTVAEMDYDANSNAAVSEPVSRIRARPDLLELIRAVPPKLKPDCVVLENLRTRELVSLSELWLLDAGALENAAQEPAKGSNAQGRGGLYLPVNHAMDSYSLKSYLDVIQNCGLDMIVIDMKDDYGRLRFTPNNPAINAKGRVFRPLASIRPGVLP
jgi:hypothetical protein